MSAMTVRYCNDLANEATAWATALEEYARAAHSAAARAQADADSKAVSEAISEAHRARAAFRTLIVRAGGMP